MDSINIPILMMKKLRHEEINSFPKVIATEWKSWTLDRAYPDPTLCTTIRFLSHKYNHKNDSLSDRIIGDFYYLLFNVLIFSNFSANEMYHLYHFKSFFLK